MEFRVGDHVRVRDTYVIDCLRGRIGTVIFVSKRSYAVDFGKPIPDGLSCGGRCQPGNGSWISVEDIELVDDLPSVIEIAELMEAINFG